MITTLPKQSGSSAAHAYAYWGDREGWTVALTVHRDSEALDRSNWDIITADILATPDDRDNEDELADAAIEQSSHFLVGWVANLLVRPGSTAERKALEWADKLASYPIANEDHFYELESREEWCVRCGMGTREDHERESFRQHHNCKFRSRDDADDIRYRWSHRHAG